MQQDWLAARVQASPNVIALHIDSQSHTYNTLDKDVASYAGWLFSLGISEGEPVAILLHNCYEYVCLIHAIMRINAVILPINARLNPQEIDYQLNHTDCKWLITSSEMHSIVGGLAVVDNRVMAFVEDAQSHVGDSVFDGQIDLEAACIIMFTSGTTGKPKGVVLTFSNLLYSAMSSAYRIGVLSDDRWLCVLPLYHIGGVSIIIRSCLYGTAVDLYGKFDVAAVNRGLTNDPVTLVSLVPTMLHRLLNSRQHKWNDKLRLVLLGGAAASPELMQKCIDENIPVATTYGLTEASSQVATTLPGEAVNKPGSVGKPLLFTSIRIVKEQETNHNKQSKYGEIVIHGPTTMKEYHKNHKETEKVLQNNELYTGDIGYLDEDNDLWIIQRRTDLIISGGENIYPTEIENIIQQHPNVDAVAVIGIDDPEWGQKVAAAIVPNIQLRLEEILDHCNLYLARYKHPREIIFVSQLPQTASGKVNRQSVKELFQ